MYGLIGNPLSHSFSPLIHKMLTGCDYRLFPLSEEEIPAFLRREDIEGLNVTIPYKQTVIPFCDALTPEAARLGSVNTLLFDKDRRLIGHNTDYEGAVTLFCRAGIDPAGKEAAILGNGGVARTLRAVLHDLGAERVRTFSRTPSPDTVSYEDAAARESVQLLINATPVGMYPRCPDRVMSLSAFPACEAFADMVYNPLVTGLCFDAAEKGIPYVNGLPMLVAQAKASAEAFTGVSIPDEKAEEVLAALTRQQTNVVLIGMPGCGKTTVGRILAAVLRREFVDLDDEVERLAGCSVPDLFRRGGEALFRQWEHRTVEEQGRRHGLVIAAGGGVVVNEDNYRPLKQNGRLYWLTCPPERLSVAGRPLSEERGVEALYAEREPRYRRFADAIMANDRSPEETAAAIKEDFL